MKEDNTKLIEIKRQLVKNLRLSKHREKYFQAYVEIKENSPIFHRELRNKLQIQSCNLKNIINKLLSSKLIKREKPGIDPVYYCSDSVNFSKLEKIRKYANTSVRYKVLNAVENSEGMTIPEISKATGLSTFTVSGAIKYLEKKNAVRVIKMKFVNIIFPRNFSGNTEKLAKEKAKSILGERKSKLSRIRTESKKLQKMFVEVRTVFGNPLNFFKLNKQNDIIGLDFSTLNHIPVTVEVQDRIIPTDIYKIKLQGQTHKYIPLVDEYKTIATVDGKIKQVTIKDLYRLFLTNHEIFVAVPRDLSEVIKTDMGMISLHDFKSLERFFIRPVNKDEFKKFLQKSINNLQNIYGSKVKLSSKLGGDSTLRDYLNMGYIRAKEFVSLCELCGLDPEKLFTDFGRRVSNIRSKKTLLLPECLDRNLAYCLGVYLTDGDREGTGNRIGILAESHQVKRKWKRCIESAIKGVKVTGSLSTRSWYCCSAIVETLFREVFKAMTGLGASHLLRSPPQICNSPMDIVNSYLEGIIDGDGGIENNGLFISTSSIANAEDLVFLFLRRKEQVAIHKPITYTINIHGKDQLEKICHDLEISVENRRLGLIEAINKKMRSSRLDTIPASLIRKYLEDENVFRKRKKLARREVETLSEKFGCLRELISSEVKWVEIFDFKVEGNTEKFSFPVLDAKNYSMINFMYIR